MISALITGGGSSDVNSTCEVGAADGSAVVALANEAGGGVAASAVASLAIADGGGVAAAGAAVAALAVAAGAVTAMVAATVNTPSPSRHSARKRCCQACSAALCSGDPAWRAIFCLRSKLPSPLA